MPDSKPVHQLFHDISTMTRKLRTRFDAQAAELGVTQSRARVLLYLARCKSPSQTALADALYVERPTMGRLLDGLEESGLVRRETSSEDRRQRLVHLTDAATSHVNTLLDLTDELGRNVTEGISDDDLAAVDRVMRQMIENLAKMDTK